MSRRIADVWAKVARSFYPLPRMTDNVLSASLGQLTGLPGEVVHSDVVKPLSSYSARQHADQAVTRRVARTFGPERIDDRPDVALDL
jgi:hypothetical protein